MQMLGILFRLSTLKRFFCAKDLPKSFCRNTGGLALRYTNEEFMVEEPHHRYLVFSIAGDPSRKTSDSG